MADFKLKRNPETGDTVFWEPGMSDWATVQARRNPSTGEVAILTEGASDWRNLGAFDGGAAPQPTAAPAPVNPGAVTQPGADQVFAVPQPPEVRNQRPGVAPQIAQPAMPGTPQITPEQILFGNTPYSAPPQGNLTPGSMTLPDLGTMSEMGRAMRGAQDFERYGAAPLAQPAPAPAQPDPLVAALTGVDMTDDARAGRGFGRTAYLDGLVDAPNIPAPNPAPRPLPAPADDRSARQPLSDLGQRFARGGTEVVASLPEAAALAGAGNPNAAALVAQETIQQAEAQIAEAQARLQSNPEQAAQINAVIAEQQRVIEAYRPLVNIAQGPLKPAPQDRPLFQRGQQVRQASLDLFGTPDPQFDDRFLGKLAEGAGSMAGFVGTTILTGPVGGALAGSGVNASGMYRRALADGATEEEAKAAAYIGSMVGASEVLPIGRALGMLPSGVRERVSGALGKRLTNAFVTAGEEGVQEALVEIANNLTEKGIWNPEQNAFEGAAESALIGAILGGGLGAIVPPGSDTQPPAGRGAPPSAEREPEQPAGNAGSPRQPDLPAAPSPAPDAAPLTPEAAVTQGGAVTQDEPGDRIEIIDETETVDGQSVPTGRKLRLNIDKGTVSPVDPEADQREAVQSQPQGAPAVGSDAAPAAGDAAQMANQPRNIEFIDAAGVANIGTEPEVMQYKAGGDAEGVTDRLRGVTEWRPERAGMSIIYEYADGRRVIADGHQRLGLAKRLASEGKTIQMPAMILREVDGITPEEARTTAALKNIAEGSGTAIDAAKVLRDTDQTPEQLGLPPSSAIVRDAMGMRNLSPDAFGMVVNGVSSERDGGIVGRVVTDQTAQANILGLLARLQKDRPVTAFQAEQIARQAAADTVTETQDSLFGPEADTQNLYLERAKVLESAIRMARDEERAFKNVVQNADRLAAAGNQLDAEGNQTRVDSAATMRDYLQREANTKGAISDALSKAARSLKDGASAQSATRQFLDAVERELAARGPERAGGDTGGQAAGGEREGQPEPEVEPQGRDENAAAGDMFGGLPTDQPTNQMTDRQRAEMEAQAQQSKIRREGGNTGDAGPLFDTQGDMLDAQPTKGGDPNAEVQGQRQEEVTQEPGPGAPANTAQPQGEAGTYVRRPANMQDDTSFTDRSDELPDRIDPAQLAQEAKRLTLEPGQRDDIEYLMMIDAEGRIIAYGSGHKSGTGVPGAFDLLEKADERIIAHHNHPSSNGFSAADIAIALTPGMDGLYAHAHDGSTFFVRSTALGRSMWQGERSSPMRSTAIISDLNNAVNNLWRKAANQINALIDSGFYPAEADQDRGVYLQPGRDRSFALMMAMRDTGIIEFDVTGPAAARFGDDSNPFLFNPELKKLYDNLVRTLKRRAQDADTEGNYDRPANARRHPGELAAAPRPADGDQAADGNDQGRNPQREERDPDEAGDGGQVETTPPPARPESEGDPDFDGALDDMFGPEGGTDADQGESAVPDRGGDKARKPSPKPKRPASAIANDMKSILRGLKEDSDLFGDTPQPSRTMTQEQRAELEARAKQSKMRTGKPQQEAGPLFDTQSDLFGFDESAPATLVDQIDALENIVPGWTSAPGGMLTNPHTRGGIIDKAMGTGEWFVVFGNGWESVDGFATRGEAVAEFVQSMKAGTDPTKYRQLAPLFIEALDGIDPGAQGRRETFGAMMRPLVDAGLTRQDVQALQPFFTRFLDDVESGRINLEGETDAPSPGGDLEQDRGDTDTGDGVGGADVPASAGGDGGRPGSRSGASRGGRGGQRTGGARLPRRDAAGVGARGDQGFSGPERDGGQPANDRDGAASRDRGEQRLPPDDGRAEDTARNATDGPDLSDRKAAQAKADKARVIPGDRANIDKTLPLLLPEQRDDVMKVEERFAKPDGHGMLLTNGTGTGKTYSGGGVIKRFVQQGKTNILIVSPKSVRQAWARVGEDLGVQITPLPNTGTAGNGVVVATLDSMHQNSTLATRDWDLVVVDESHKIMENRKGEVTKNLDTLRAITNRPQDLWRRARMINADAWAAWEAMPGRDTKILSQEQREQAQRVKDQRRSELMAADQALIDQWQRQPRSKVLFLSATPFATVKSLDMMDGYLIDYGGDWTTASGSRQDGRARFYVDNFGYRIRYHRLTEPEGAVDQGLMARQFHNRMRDEGKLSGRQLDVDADYDRKFVQIDSVDGAKIDEAIAYVHEMGSEKKSSPKEVHQWRELADHIRRSFGYLERAQLLEAIKAEAVIPDIRKHLALGRQVVVFHDFLKGGGFNPFNNRKTVIPTADAMEAYQMLIKAKPWVKDLNFAGLKPPVAALKAAFGNDAVIYNGTVTNEKKRQEMVDAFQRDGAGPRVFVVQAQAGREGISLHDTTGQHQRVLINLGMPTRPTTSLQQEGRIRRVGSVSDALFRYYTIGTSWERRAFAQTIAERAGIVEDLALGDEARSIRQSFIDAYLEADRFEPGVGEEGKGGKERDRAAATSTPFDAAKSHYFARMRDTRRRDRRDGIDHFATPEPLGFKMAQWAKLRSGQKVLEPSVGDGAIARYLPADADRTIIEPSFDLLTRAQLNTPGASTVQETFERHHIVNKYDAVVMNPPFGSGGKTAYEHVAKAMRHTRIGGRVVALVPTGPAADKQFEKMMGDLGDDLPMWDWAADISLPAVTFERAGTSVAARVLIFDKVGRDGEKSDMPQRINMTGAQSIGDFFDRLEDIDVRERPAVSERAVEVESAVEPAISGEAGGPEMTTITTKAGKELPAVAYPGRVDHEVWGALLDMAKTHGGWSHRVRGRPRDAGPVYAFRTEEARAAFIEDTQKPRIGLEETAYHGTPHDFDTFSLDAIGTGEGAQAYGWGLYFAGLKDVAEHYRKKGIRQHAVLTVDGKTIRAGDARMADKTAEQRAAVMAYRALEDGQQVWVATQKARNAVKEAERGDLTDFQIEGGWGNTDVLKDVVRILEKWEGADVQLFRGRLFAVDIPNADTLLDWDKPLTKQPEAVRAIIATMPEAPDRSAWDNTTGSDLYQQLVIDQMGDDAFTKASAERRAARDRAQKPVSLLLRSYGIPGHRYLDGMSRNRPLNDIKREFLDQLPEDASFDDVMGMIGTGAFSPTNESILQALEGDDWLGFDYPAQAISAALSSRISGFDPSQDLLDAVQAAQSGGSHNYVIYDAEAVRVIEKERRAEATAEALRPVMPALRAELDRLNLKRVKLSEEVGQNRAGAFTADGTGAMEILIGRSLDPEATLYHESIHAMKHMDLFTPAEWKALEIKAGREWVEKYDIPARYPDLLPSEQIEEAIAEAFAEAAKTKTPPKGSILIQAFNKIARFFKALGNALRGAGFQTAEDVFGRALAGEIGARDAGNTGVMAALREARAPKRQGPQQQANAASAMGANGGYAFIPDRRIWEEISASNAGIWQRLAGGGGAAMDWVDKARIHLQDRFLPVMRAQQAVMKATGQPLTEEQNAYLAEETFSGKVGRHLFEIDEDYTKPIIEIMAGDRKEAILDAEYVGTWLYARHAQERNARIASINPNMPDGGSGLTDAEAQLILDEAKASGNIDRLNKIGDLIDKLRERTLKLREDAGLITAQEADIWRNQYKFYVPLKGFADTDHSEAMLDVTGMGRRFNTRGEESKRALGRHSEAFNPLQAALTQAQETAIRAEKNRVGQALYNLAKDFPSPALWSVKTPKQKRYYNRTTGLVETRVEDPLSLFLDPNEMAVKIGGQERRIMFHDERLARAAGSMGADQMGAITRFVGMFGRYFSSINTMLNPVFTVVNGFRDMITAQITIGHFGGKDANRIRKAMVKNWPKAWLAAYRGQLNKADTEWTKYYQEFDQAGAKVAFWRIEQPEAERLDLQRRVRDIGAGPARRSIKYLRFSTRDNPVLGFVERTNLAVDNAIRLAAYVEARKAGWSQAEAASLSKNMTVNFNRRGEMGAGINAWYVFANAAIQGTHTLVRSMKSKQVRRIILSIFALSVLQDLVNAVLSDEDEDGELAYDKIPMWKGQMNSMLMLSAFGGDGSTAATVPLPYGYNAFTFAGMQAGKIIRGVKDPDEALRDTALTAFTAFSPISGSTTYSMIMPTILDPISEMAMNEDWLGRPIRPESPYNDFGPDAYKYYGGVSTASKLISDALNRATGGTIAEAGAIDISPEYIDHMAGFLTGGMGRFVGQTGDLLTKAVRGEWEDIEQRDVPFAGRLYTTTGDWLDRSRYYDFRQEVREARDAMATYTDAGQPVPQDVRRLAGLYDANRRAEKVLREARAQIRAIEARDDLSAAEKSKRRAAIDDRTAKVYLGFNKAFLRVAGRQGE